MSPFTSIRILIAGIILVFFVLDSGWAKVDQATRFLERSASLKGPTGWINIPSPAISESGKMAAAIHRGEAKINLGLLDIMEAGIAFEADQLGIRFEPYRDLSSMEQVKKNFPEFFKEAFRGQVKLKLLDQDWAYISLAGGIEEQNKYVVVQRYFAGLSRVTFLVGWGNGRFEKGFGGFSKTIFPGAELMFEYDGQGVDFGLRLLLASNLIMTLAGQDLNTVGEVENLGEVIGNHLLFGITYVERVW